MNDFVIVRRKTSLFTTEFIDKVRDKENAALSLCGGLLAPCYIMAEVLSYRYAEVRTKVQKEKWYRHTAKKTFKTFEDALDKHLTRITCNSRSKTSYMREFSDNMYEEVAPLIEQTKRSVGIDLMRDIDVCHTDIYSDFVLCVVFMQYIRDYYDSVIRYMGKIMPSNYDSYYHYVKAEHLDKLFNNCLKVYAEAYGLKAVDYTPSKSTKIGFEGIYNRLESGTVSERVRIKTSEVIDDDVPENLHEENLRKLAI